MEFEWDEAKYQTNIIKHKVSFDLVMRFSWENAIIEPDRRHDYGEDRFVARGYIDTVGYTVVFTTRAEIVRIISVRKFNRKEYIRYAQQE